MNKANIIKAFQPSLSEDSLKLIELFSDLEQRQKINSSIIKEINDLILERQSKLSNKMIETDIKVNTALFGDRKFQHETLSYQIPMEARYFETDNISIKDGIITPKPKLKSDTNKKPIELSAITSRRDTDFKILNGKLYIDKNLSYPYQELEVNLPKDTSTSFLYINLDRFEKVSILNRFGRELEDRSITNSIVIPVNAETKSIILRFENNINKVIQIKDIYLAENSFETTTQIETKNIQIGQYLQEIAINTCDNYSDPNIDMSYYISINNRDFREIRPLNKHKKLDLKSILSTDDTLNVITLEDAITTDLGSMYTLDHMDSPDFHIIKAFKGKLGDNVGLTQRAPITIYSEEVVNIILHSGMSINVNGELLDISTDNYILKLEKGFNTLTIDPLLWNQKEDLLKYSIEEVSKDKLTLLDKETSLILTKSIEDPTKKESLSVFLQLVDKVSIYLDEYEAKPVYINQTKYITKESPNSSYIFIKYRTRLVDTIKLRVNMQTTNPRIPAYISSITVRGV